jgi:hypothetical protein
MPPMGAGRHTESETQFLKGGSMENQKVKSSGQTTPARFFWSLTIYDKKNGWMVRRIENGRI